METFLSQINDFKVIGQPILNSRVDNYIADSFNCYPLFYDFSNFNFCSSILIFSSVGFCNLLYQFLYPLIAMTIRIIINTQPATDNFNKKFRILLADLFFQLKKRYK